MRVFGRAHSGTTGSGRGGRGWRRATVLAVGFVAAPLVVGLPAANADIVVSGCTIVDNPTPTNFTNCPGVDLERSKLPNVNLAYANLSGARLYFAELFGANLTGANLTGAELSGIRLDRANATGADFTGSRMSLAQAFDANFTGANLTNVQLSNTILSRAKLAGANFTGAAIRGVYLDGTILVPSNRRVAANPATGTANVEWPTPPNLTGTTFEGCDRESGSSFPVGESTVRCNVRTSLGSTAFGTFTVTVDPRSIPTVAGVPFHASVGEFYSFHFEVTGAPWPEIRTTSVLPRGLTLDSWGNLTGTPTEAGTFPLTLIARSESGESTFQTQLVVEDNRVAGSLGGLFGS
ncbi:hypothetical protein GS896_27410 [Rhodococcus hoagii]|nr:hypothetical protein [Prescottella equi]MBM4653980.1 hypothetical protein [Prescottella equi]MBM4719754.1 hypothetical protein [Prescottella equi]NKR23554.1 hypothetical protein [Prescottella equi]NKT56292.1 hypothetical protein [Prescottella equi]